MKGQWSSWIIRECRSQRNPEGCPLRVLQRTQAEATATNAVVERLHEAVRRLRASRGADESLVTQRMKCSGLRWRHAGGQAILTLRGLVQSERFEHGWQLLAQTYRADIAAPDNVVAFPPARPHRSSV